MALETYDQIRQEIFDLSLQDLIKDYVSTEQTFHTVDEVSDTEWMYLSNRIELIEDRIWSTEKFDEWIPLYCAIVPRSLLQLKVTRYTNYIHRLGHLKNKEGVQKRWVARYRLFLSYVTGHHTYLQQ